MYNCSILHLLHQVVHCWLDGDVNDDVREDVGNIENSEFVVAAMNEN